MERPQYGLSAVVVGGGFGFVVAGGCVACVEVAPAAPASWRLPASPPSCPPSWMPASPTTRALASSAAIARDASIGSTLPVGAALALGAALADADAVAV